jgi:hypothetical protein
MATSSVDLASLFGSVVNTLAQNQTALNKADTYNHNHGDNMVEIFEVITQAMKEKSSATPADQLAYASQILSRKSQSGSAQVYAQGLSNASTKFQGKKAVTPNSAMTLIQTLLGAQAKIPTTSLGKTSTTPSDSGADLLGSLLGGLTGGTTSSAPASSGSGDLLGSLIGGVAGSGTTPSAQTGQVDLAKLLKAGMAFAQSKGEGESTLQAITEAMMANSNMATSQHRSQSGALVANTLLQALAGMSKK